MTLSTPAFLRQSQHCADFEMALFKRVANRLSAIIAPFVEQPGLMGKGQYFAMLKRSLNLDQRMAIALQTGNRNNLRQLLRSEGWTQAQLHTVLDSLRLAEWQAIQEIWDVFTELQFEIGTCYRQLFGVEPDWSTPRSFLAQCAVSSGGRIAYPLRGGFYPLCFVATNAESGMALIQRSYCQNTADILPATPLFQSLAAAYMAANTVIHTLAWQNWLNTALHLQHHPEFGLNLGESALPQFKRRIQQMTATDQAIAQGGQQCILALQQHSSRAGLGLQVLSTALRCVDWQPSLAAVEPSVLAEAIKIYWVDQHMALDKSALLRHRQACCALDTVDSLNHLLGRAALLRDSLCWLAHYIQAVETDCTEAQAIATADYAIKALPWQWQNITEAEQVFKRFQLWVGADYDYVWTYPLPVLLVQRLAGQDTQDWEQLTRQMLAVDAGALLAWCLAERGYMAMLGQVLHGAYIHHARPDPLILPP